MLQLLCWFADDINSVVILFILRCVFMLVYVFLLLVVLLTCVVLVFEFITCCLWLCSLICATCYCVVCFGFAGGLFYLVFVVIDFACCVGGCWCLLWLDARAAWVYCYLFACLVF